MESKNTSAARQSYLVAATGQTRGVLAQVFASDEHKACAAVSALCLDSFGEKCEAVCIDTDAQPGLWLEGDPAYIRVAIAAGSAA